MSSSTFIAGALSTERKMVPFVEKKHEIYAGPRIQFNFDEIKQCPSDLALKIQSIKTSKLNNLSIKQGALSIEEIESEINLLNTADLSTLTDEETLTIEEYKAILMIAVQNHLQNNRSLKPSPELSIIKTKEKSTAMWVAFYGLMVFEFAPMIFGRITITKLVMSSLMFYIPLDLPLIIWTGLSLGCVLNNLVGNISFMAPILLERLGLASSKKTQSLAETHQLQLEATEAINNKLITDNDFSSTDFHAYAKLAKLFNHQMATLKNNYPSFKNSFFSSVVNGFMGFFSTIHGISNALFTSAAMVSAIMGTITGTTLTAAAVTASMPLTIALVGTLFVVPNIAMSYYLRMRSTSKALNPGAEQHAIVKDNLDSFEKKDDIRFNRIYNKKLAAETNAEAGWNTTVHTKKTSMLEIIRQRKNSQTMLEDKATNIDKQTITQGLQCLKR